MNSLVAILLIVATFAAVMWLLTALDAWQRNSAAVPLRARLVAWHYRLFHDPEPYDTSFAEAPAAERPRVVAGSDLDRLCGADAAQTNTSFADLVAASLGDVQADPRLAELYVAPEVER